MDKAPVMRVPRWLWAGALGIVLVAAGTVFVPEAEAQEPPTFTDPIDGAHLSLGTDDADSASPAFQYRIRGTAEAGAEVEVSASRPDGDPEVLGTTTADSQGNWDLLVTFGEPGEYDLQATQTTEEGTSDPAEIKTFIVLRYVFTWYDDVNSAANWVLVSNPGEETTRAEIFVDGEQRGETLALESGELAAPRFRGLIGGPVVVDSLDGRPLVTTQRTTWRSGDLEEVAGVYDGYLTDESWFTWYDTENTNGRDWVVVTNFGDGQTAVEVTVGDTSLGSQAVAPGEAAAFKANGTIGGPVHVTADEPVLASRRTLWKPTNFVELVGTPDRWLARDHTFTWFDSVNTNNADWLMVANPQSEAMTVRMDLPDTDPTEFELGAGDVTVRQFPGTIGGPVGIQTDLPAVVTQRALWSGARSFEEVASVPVEETTSTYWHTVYDKVNARGDWLLQASAFEEDDAGAPDVPYTISAPCIDHSSTLEPGDVEAPQFNGAICGTVVVAADESDDGVRLPFLQSKRTLWKGAKRDFMEFPGLRGTHLTGRANQVAAPGSVTVSDVPNDDGGNLDISWSAVDDPTVDGYWVYRVISTDPLVEQRVAYTPQDQCEPNELGTSSTCEARDTGLTPDEEVTYNVRALSLATVEGVRAQGSGTPIDNPPSAPTWPEEGATTSGDEEVALDWNDNPEIENVVGYHVYFAEDPSQTGASGCATLGDGDYTQDTSGDGVAESEHTVTGLTNDTRYCFQVTAQDGADQESDRSETQTETPEAVPPQVTVTEPNGGEVLRGDGSSTFEITWTDDDPDGNKDFVQIFYSTNPSEPGTWISITDGTDNDGSFVWDPPAIDSETVMVRVRATDEKDNQNQDRSDAFFAIDSSDPEVTVTSPEADDEFAGGDDIDVEFDYTEPHPEDVTVAVSVDGSAFEAVTCSGLGSLSGGTDVSESCTWTAPDDITSEDVVLRVTMTDEVGHSGSDTSAAFAIDSTAPPAPEITEVHGQAVDSSDDPPHASGDDPSPETVVEGQGESPFSEDGTVRFFVGGTQPSCADTPDATMGVSEGQASVTFNSGDDEDFTTTEGNNNLWVCMRDEVGNDSPVSELIVYELDTS